MEGDSPAQLPVAQQTQAQASPGQPVVYQQPFAPGQPITAVPGQPIMYQMPPGQQQQQQPVFVQVPAGQPATTADGQPIQYYYVPMQPGQPVQQGQPVYVQSPAGQTGQPQQQAGQGLELTFDTDFIKSPLCYIKIAEFVVLLGAWASILKYFDDLDDATKKSKTVLDDEKADFFKGITIFCWVMVILFLIIHIMSLPKICNCKRPSMFTLASLIFYFIMFALLLACTGNLVSRAVEFGDVLKLGGAYKKASRPFVVALSVALAFGFLSCIAFVVDMVLNYKLFQTQRAQETPPEQGPPQRRAWDVNFDYLRSPVFYVKLAEIAILFGAWVCIIKYLDMNFIKRYALQNVDPPEAFAIQEADFFKAITIFSWVMVIILALTFVLSFDKLCSRSSTWTLTTLVIYFVLSILLIACCGTLTKPAVDWGKTYKYASTLAKPNILALPIGLALGYISWIIFIVDISLIYKLYRQQRMQEFVPQQQLGQPAGVIQQPAVVIVPQGAKQQAYQPVAHPGQQQPVIMMGMPPPAYSQQSQQGEYQK